ncbi:MAG: amino acid adenylation domain-containing protein, partial [Synergistaceae bacterium]|nr:amino acid adenylation domain-containing protein [Synergistaceae bacterium]
IKLTYHELDDITERIAGYIANKGLGVGDVVSILIPRGEYMPITVIGVLKAGCAYQPLDSTYPPERLNFMLKDSGAKLLITTEELRPLITDYKGEVLILSEIASMPACSVKLPEVKPEDLFILLYTSGSTGTPKGVRLTHGNLVCFVNWYHRYYNLQPEDCIGQYASFGFDAGMQDICSAVTLGATLCVIPEEIRLDLNAINEYIERHHVTHQFMTTQIARQFAVNIENHSLKTLLCGGEKLVPLTPPAGYKFQNGYGPTECTCCVAVYHVKEYMENIPIGKANDNVKLYIVDSDGHRVPVGALGELWVSGQQVGDGYLNRPDKTVEAFIDNPFNSDPNYNKVYKTGDIVRYKADGNIEFFGRRDGQVKIRGFRIELSEVEAVIRQFPGITDATVAAFDNESGEGKYLAAYVVSDEKVDIKALNDFIKSKKPPYMVPAVTMQIDKIPLTQNGKVNKRALPKAVAAQSDYEAAANDVERAFCKIFCSILQLDDVGATEDFFSLGGTSILVTLLLIEAEKAGYRVTFQDVFSRPTPRMLAGLFIDETDVAAEPEHYDEIRDYDYSKLQPILDANTLDNFKAGVQQPLGDILLTGATGYLGVHTLHELLERYDGKVYCLLRSKGGYTAERRLKNQLFYYFENTYEDLLNKRLFVIDGDITKPIPKLPVSTVINCAAIV